MKKNSAGYITVYLALTLGIIVSFMTTMIVGARMHTIRFETECVMDMGLNSIFAEYHREMLKQYGLLYIDSSYGGSSPSPDFTRAHLLHYMNANLDKSENLFATDLTRIHADNATLNDITYATDDSGAVLRYQICKYLESIYGMNILLDMGGDVERIGASLDEYGGYESMREAASASADSIIEEYNSKLPPEEEPYSISNPADSVETLSGSNALFYATGMKGSISSQTIDGRAYVSGRVINEGAGLREGQEMPTSVTSKLMLIKYVFDKCGYYGHEKAGGLLQYQIEYLVNGNEEDIRNLEEVASDIFKVRYVSNMAFLLSNGAKKSEAELLATAICAILLSPELIKAVTYTILFAWGYAESAKDVRIIFDGHKMPLVKSEANWNTPLDEMITFKAHLDSYRVPTGGLSYEQYLLGFLLMKNVNELTMRLMDVMEMDIRMTPGNSRFRMDGLIYQLVADVNVTSKYGYGCNIRRFFTYE